MQHDFQYVTRAEAKPARAELLQIIREVHYIVRNDFTFQHIPVVYCIVVILHLSIIVMMVDSSIYDLIKKTTTIPGNIKEKALAILMKDISG